MNSLANKSSLAHLEANDRWEAEEMLVGLGLKYYGLISHSRVVDMYTLKQIYGTCKQCLTANHTHAVYSTATLKAIEHNLINI